MPTWLFLLTPEQRRKMSHCLPYAPSYDKRVVANHRHYHHVALVMIGEAHLGKAPYWCPWLRKY